MEEHPLAALMQSAESGDANAARHLFTALYDELHQMARQALQRLGGGLTLGAGTLLHETYLKLMRREDNAYPDRARFMAYASRAMRGLIIDYARRGRALRHGGGFDMTTLPSELPATATAAEHERLERLSDAVDRLAAQDPDLAELVDLKYFSGFSFAEIAAMRGVTERTVYRHWDKARIYLYEWFEEADEK